MTTLDDAPPDDRGLSTTEAKTRLAAHGPNALPEKAPPALWRRVASQFHNPLVYVLLAALTLELILWATGGSVGVPFEAVMIGALLALNAGLGAAQEAKADRAMTALRALAAPKSWAKRDGQFIEVDARDLVPGDVVRLRHGERVPADGVLVASSGVAVDESLLTGESLPVEKPTLADVKSGTLAVRGSGLVHVLRTGAKSATGALATSLGEVAADRTPLEKRLHKLGNALAIAMAGLGVGLGVAGLAVAGLDGFARMLLFGAALAVAAVPEGLPAAATLTLALGVKRMAARNAIVRKLSAVETLGTVTVIATDKTGTLTENHVRVNAVETTDEAELLAAMVIVNDTTDAADDGSLDACLLAYARDKHAPVDAYRALPRQSARPFDSAWKYARVTVARPDPDEPGRARIVSYLKGAPELVIARLRVDAAAAIELAHRAHELARAGHRVLAFARGEGDAETSLDFLGFALLGDPPRPEVKGAIAAARAAGIRVLMMTGDHPETARAIAREVGIEADLALTGAELDALEGEELEHAARSVHVFARVRPEHKLRLVDALTRAGEIVAVTGDGVNDAPALKRSAVGVAMGKRGSDVARGVADIVLADDDFASIVAAIEEGRNAYENIQTFIRFTLATNLGLVVVMLAGAIASIIEATTRGAALVLPLTALQLLWINFLGDGPPALALVLDRDRARMAKPPRPLSSGSIDGASLRFIGLTGASKGAIGVALLFGLPALGLGAVEVQTALFSFASIAKLASIYPARSSGAASTTLERNRTLLAVVVGGIALQVVAATWAVLRQVLELDPIGPSTWAFLASAVAVDVALGFLFARAMSRAPRSARITESVTAAMATRALSASGA